MQEELGYVELEWVCKNCGTRNPGTRKNCMNCGAAMPADAKFELPAQQEYIQDEAKITEAKAGPDLACPYCGTRNPSTAKTCKQCGGDLTGGRAREAGAVLGAYSDAKLPDVKCPNCGTMNPAVALKCSNCAATLPRAAPQPSAATSAATATVAPPFKTSPLMLGGIAAVLLACLAGAYFLFFRTTETIGTVEGVNWQRTIAIMALAPVRDADWEDRLPAEATVLACEMKPRRMSNVEEPNSTKVCGTPYVIDQGTGAGRVVQDCQFSVSEEYCSFTRLQLTVIDTIVARGTDLQPNWPQLALKTGEQEGNRAEDYSVVFEAGGQRYTYTPGSQDEFARFRPGSRWALQVNGLGGIINATPAQ
jgi:DNA-directed RNA polymerase subunit RPC12/RpoP